MRFLLVMIIGGGVAYLFYMGLVETGVLTNSSTPAGYYAAEVAHEHKFGVSSEGEKLFHGWHRNNGDRDLEDIQVTIFARLPDGKSFEMDTVGLGTLDAGQNRDFEVVFEWPKGFAGDKRSTKYTYELTAEFVD